MTVVREMIEELENNKASGKSIDWDSFGEKLNAVKNNTDANILDRLEADRELKEIKERLNRRGITEKFLSSTLENYIGNDNLVAELHSWDKKQNIIFHGKTANGKTHLAVALCKLHGGHIIDWYKLSNVIYLDVLDGKNNIFRNREDFFNYYTKSIKFLCIDEIDKKQSTTASKDLLFEILKVRDDNLLPTLIITNIEDLNGLNEIIKEQAIRRLVEDCLVFSFQKEPYKNKERK